MQTQSVDLCFRSTHLQESCVIDRLSGHSRSNSEMTRHLGFSERLYMHIARNSVSLSGKATRYWSPSIVSIFLNM